MLDDHVVQLSQMVDVFHNGVWTPNIYVSFKTDALLGIINKR